MSTKATIFAFICISLLISSCVTTARFEDHYDDWVGSNVSTLIEAWGEAQETKTLKNGITELSYNMSISKRKPLPDTCILTFIVNRKGIITGIKHKGNYCRKGLSFV